MYCNEFKTRERMLQELWSNLMNLVESNDMTDIEAMEWYNDKADKWAEGI